MADWWDDQSVTGGYGADIGPPSEGDFVVLGLYNDGMQGWYLYLDGFDVSAGSSFVESYQVEGVDGKEVSPGIPILSGLGKLPGSLWYYDSVSTPPLRPINNQLSTTFQLTADTPPQAVRSRGPLAVIKPGYSYNVCCINADGINPLVVNFYWTALNG
jgi:hypothetical protein